MQRIDAPIDNKSLCEDAFEDDVFREFDAAPDHRNGKGVRHLVGTINLYDYDKELIGLSGIVDVKWHWGDSHITITLLAYNRTENLYEVRDEIFKHYRQVFKAWECGENHDLKVEFYELNDKLNVIFYFECE